MNKQNALVREAQQISHDYKWTLAYGQDNAVTRRAQERRISRLSKIINLLGFDPTV